MQVPVNKTVYPLSSAQSMLLWGEIFSIEPQKAKEENIISFYFQVSHNCDLVALEKTYNKIIEINDALRIRIFGHKLKYRQYIKDFYYEKLEVLSLQGEEGFQQYLKTIYNNKINWTDDNLVWAKIIDCGQGNGVLVFRCHHACMDGYSMGLLYEQIDKCYANYAVGQEPLFENRYSIIDYFTYQGKYVVSKQHDRDKEFWRYAYNHQPNYSFPAGKRALKGDASSVSVALADFLYEDVLSLAQDTACSVQGILMSLAAITVYVLTNKDNFAIYSLTHGRRNIKLRQTVGCMQNTVPIFYHVLPKAAAENWIKEVMLII